MNSAFQAMYQLLQRDPRYKFEAYQFVREALAFAQDQMLFGKPEAAQPLPEVEGADEPADEAKIMTGRHITGQQLCEACRLYGLRQYGYLAGMVLGTWGVRSTGDFGEIVYNLIRIDQMRKSESDRREDFDDVYSFANAFEPQFDAVASENTG
jgi:uncharacterized repeat protein (TIGR04138 family)